MVVGFLSMAAFSLSTLNLSGLSGGVALTRYGELCDARSVISTLARFSRLFETFCRAFSFFEIDLSLLLTCMSAAAAAAAAPGGRCERAEPPLLVSKPLFLPPPPPTTMFVTTSRPPLTKSRGRSSSQRSSLSKAVGGAPLQSAFLLCAPRFSAALVTLFKRWCLACVNDDEPLAAYGGGGGGSR